MVFLSFVFIILSSGGYKGLFFITYLARACVLIFSICPFFFSFSLIAYPFVAIKEKKIMDR